MGQARQATHGLGDARVLRVAVTTPHSVGFTPRAGEHPLGFSVLSSQSSVSSRPSELEECSHQYRE
jgi:hypothetical protein